ncbi:MAG: ring-cleaving dioxygenase [Spirosomataceae bacterium]
MNNNVLGLHHVTAIAGNAQRNFDFYTNILGLRFVKKTVNFDDPHTYHFYYGNYPAEPGTILTFFPWGTVVPGRRGPGQATEIGFSVPAGSLDFWLKRFEQHGVIYNKPATKFGEEYLTFLDPDGLKMELTVSAQPDNRQPNVVTDIDESAAIKGFQNVTLTLANAQPTAEVLTELLDYQLVEQNVNRYRFVNTNVGTASVIDLVEAPGERRGHVAGGSVHHVAFRVKDDATHLALREKIAAKGYQVTDQIDRNYFHSIYFREPGGVLFEVATDNPGFTADEPLNDLGNGLKLPAMYEGRRAEIEAVLPVLK